MGKYEILEHKADLKIRVFGKTKEELFLNAMIGMFGGARYEPDPKAKSKKRKISIKALDLPSLLVDFLSEVLYLSEVNREVYFDVKFSKFSDPSTDSGQAELGGELIGQEVMSFGEDIKAVTYHDLEISQKKDGNWEAVVLFDI